MMKGQQMSNHFARLPCRLYLIKLAHYHYNLNRSPINSHQEPIILEVYYKTMEVVEFKVRLHCKACEKAVRKSLLKINGVKCVEIDMISSKITVLGYVDRKALVKAIHKTGRRAEVWPTSAASCRREDYFSPRLPKGFRCIIPRWGFPKFEK